MSADSGFRKYGAHSSLSLRDTLVVLLNLLRFHFPLLYTKVLFCFNKNSTPWLWQEDTNSRFPSVPQFSQRIVASLIFCCMQIHLALPPNAFWCNSPTKICSVKFYPYAQNVHATLLWLFPECRFCPCRKLLQFGAVITFENCCRWCYLHWQLRHEATFLNTVSFNAYSRIIWLCVVCSRFCGLQLFTRTNRKMTNVLNNILQLLAFTPQPLSGFATLDFTSHSIAIRR